MPVGVIAYQPSSQNRMAQSISIENQRSKWINRGRIARYFYCKEKKNQVYLADKTFQFDMDTVKGVVYFNDITQNQLLNSIRRTVSR